MSMPLQIGGEVLQRADAWLAKHRQIDATPAGVRLRLHLARALLVQTCAGIPAGAVDWSHPRAIDVQLAQIEWDELTPDEREAGERTFRAWHGLCAIDRCRLAVAAASTWRRAS